MWRLVTRHSRGWCCQGNSGAYVCAISWGITDPRDVVRKAWRVACHGNPTPRDGSTVQRMRGPVLDARTGKRISAAAVSIYESECTGNGAWDSRRKEAVQIKTV
ncbi:uncharacterized protein N7482_009630 [Penicillium canariense]|uniref:Uncharacterized protein n=1 Tax=Penicillium canariense TaxID=189055 RepID=A0A9W9HPR4_9EURO|nr:uncharacterized protein N7482_009630 [Penicillium canariense]KAJ5153152.1 hypothetical protein N7482_009630 [Penicillium canariense]